MSGFTLCFFAAMTFIIGLSGILTNMLSERVHRFIIYLGLTFLSAGLALHCLK